MDDRRLAPHTGWSEPVCVPLNAWQHARCLVALAIAGSCRLSSPPPPQTASPTTAPTPRPRCAHRSVGSCRVRALSKTGWGEPRPGADVGWGEASPGADVGRGEPSRSADAGWGEPRPSADVGECRAHMLRLDAPATRVGGAWLWEARQPGLVASMDAGCRRRRQMWAVLAQMWAVHPRARSVVAGRGGGSAHHLLNRMNRCGSTGGPVPQRRTALRAHVRCLLVLLGGARGRPCEAARGLQGALARAEGERQPRRLRLG